MLNDYLKRILKSRVYDVAKETTLDPAILLSKQLNNQIYLKREDTQDVFSFKIRGAYNKIANLSQEALKKGVVTSSAGNHAQGVALSAQKLGCRAVIVMPTTTPQVKIDAVRSRGAEIVLHGESYSDAYLYAKQLEAQQGLNFVHAFDDPDVIAGQGTIALEIFRQHPGDIDMIFVAIGGGGLISGIASYAKALNPNVKVIGVQAEGSDAMMRSIQAGKRVELSDVSLFSDGTAVKLVGEETFRLCQQYVDDFVIASTDEICAAVKDVFQETRSILEPAGALALAGLKQYVKQHNIQNKNLIAIACGANMNFDRLRFVAERADVGRAREAIFAVSMPEERGSFKRFCSLVGERHVTEFNYRMTNTTQAHVFVGLQIQAADETQDIAKIFEDQGFGVINLTNNELAKTHLRHMIGGINADTSNELLYRFEFPERPGALMRFLTMMPPEWNISLFHYRNQGADFGRIVVGLQVPEEEVDSFQQVINQIGYPCWNETHNPAYELFLK